MASLAFGGAADFNGRWNLTVPKDPRSRAWWLEVTDAGTPRMKGRFVGAPGGQLDEIPVMRVEGSDLVWEFERVYRRNADDRETAKGLYRAKVVAGELVGWHEIAGRAGSRLDFLGKRAPALDEKDDGKWKRGNAVELFNGKDTGGWRSRTPGGQVQWVVEKGLLKNLPRAADIRSAADFWNFHLHAEFRVEKGSNSGIGLRGRYEVSILEDHGKPLDGHSNAAIYSRIVPKVNASKPAGEWQTFDVTLIGREVTVALNGVKVIDHQEIEGLTAMATDPREDQPGPITLQGDHGLVEFRKMTLTPLTR